MTETAASSSPASSSAQTGDGSGHAIIDVVCEWALYISAALITAGVLTPSVFRPRLFGGEEYTVLGAVSQLASSGLWGLATIVIVFSVLFPLAKTLIAAVIFRFGNRTSKRAAQIMQFLGKWSMLDVFLVALLIALTQMSELRSLEARPGLYLFAAGVILNNIATARLAWARAV